MHWLSSGFALQTNAYSNCSVHFYYFCSIPNTLNFSLPTPTSCQCPRWGGPYTLTFLPPFLLLSPLLLAFWGVHIKELAEYRQNYPGSQAGFVFFRASKSKQFLESPVKALVNTREVAAAHCWKQLGERRCHELLIQLEKFLISCETTPWADPPKKGCPSNYLSNHCIRCKKGISQVSILLLGVPYRSYRVPS